MDNRHHFIGIFLLYCYERQNFHHCCQAYLCRLHQSSILLLYIPFNLAVTMVLDVRRRCSRQTAFHSNGCRCKEAALLVCPAWILESSRRRIVFEMALHQPLPPHQVLMNCTVVRCWPMVPDHSGCALWNGLLRDEIFLPIPFRFLVQTALWPNCWPAFWHWFMLSDCCLVSANRDAGLYTRLEMLVIENADQRV